MSEQCDLWFDVQNPNTNPRCWGDLPDRPRAEKVDLNMC